MIKKEMIAMLLAGGQGSLHCMGCICFFTRKPVTFCEFHLFITS